MREVKGCRTRRGSPVLKLWTKPEMDRPAILKTSRPGVPVRFKGMCWVSIDSCSSVQWKGSQTTIHPPISIVLINPNEQKRPKVFEPSKNGSPLSQKMDEPWSYVPLEKPPLERFTALDMCKFTATCFVSYSLLFAEKRQKEQTKWQIESLCRTFSPFFLVDW